MSSNPHSSPLVIIQRLTQRTSFWFLLTTCLFGLHLLTSRFHTQVYDAGGYWELTQKLYNNGQFSLYNFDSQLRGYLFPLLYVPVIMLAKQQPLLSEVTLIKLLGASLAGLLFGVLLPSFWQTITGTTVQRYQRLLVIGISFLLWRDYFNYTLTDFPAVAALFGALILLLRSPKAGHYILVGILSASAIYSRPVYLPIVPLLMFLLLWIQTVKLRTSRLRTAWSLLLFSAGFSLLALPQWLINTHNFYTNTFLVIGIDQNDPVMRAKGNLYLQKISEGFSVQKYETSIASDHPNPQVMYRDPAGIALLGLDFTHEIESYGEYISFVIHRPLDFAALYARHFFNGLDVLYPTPYLYQVYKNTTGLAWLNYSVFFAALLSLLYFIRQARKPQIPQVLAVSILLLPAVVALPLAVECRYFLPLHLLVVMMACFGLSKVRRWAFVQENRLVVIGFYVTFVLLCYTLSANTQAMLIQGPKLLACEPMATSW